LENERQKNKIVYELELLRYFRAQEVVREIAAIGFKKIGKVKIADIKLKGEYDYDGIMTLSRAIREEERFAII
jgi:hypothetical protein